MYIIVYDFFMIYTDMYIYTHRYICISSIYYIDRYVFLLYFYILF